LTFDEYLAIERKAERKSEFHDGVAVALAGTSPVHNRLVGNLWAALLSRLRSGPCVAYASDVRVHAARRRRSFYPDVFVVCGPHEFHDTLKDTVLNPVVIIEVLSDSTEAFDRGEKFEHYQSIESLREYVLVSQKTAKVERYSRQPFPKWSYELVPGEVASLRLSSIDVEIPLAEIYEAIDGLEPSAP